jgi:hypothetical protein
MTTTSPLLSFGIFALFMSGFVFYLYLIIKRATRKSKSVLMTPEMKAALNTEVTLTSEEQKTMRRGLIAAGVLIGIILLGFIATTGWEYYRFVMTGEKVTATIINKSSHRSSGKRHRTTYTYTLQATVNDVVVKDSYSAGSSGGYAVGDVITAYATNESSPELAIAGVEDRDPLFEIFYVLGLGGVSFLAVRQWKKIRSGKMRLANLPLKYRNERLRMLRVGTSVSVPTRVQISAPRATTASGLPTYTIGPGNEGNDGSNYKV